MQWLGVDVGGTFTDLVIYDRTSGRVTVDKVPSTPHDPSEAIITGIERLGLDLRSVEKLAHGTTVATNTLLERKGGPIAVLTTRGFRDVLEVGRGNRTRMYDIKATRPKPLVPRSLVFEIDERTMVDGTVLRGVHVDEVEQVCARLKEADAQGVAICYLHAYANGANERQTKEIVARALPDAVVATSAEVLPEYREFERFATTAVNVYVAPRMGRYLRSLRDRLAKRGYDRPIAIMTSNGGVWPLERTAEFPVNSVLSGPAAGAIGAAYLGRAAGYGDLITCDMGGTSTDTCLLRKGQYVMATDGVVGTLPVKVLQIEINSIGAGAGSIASLDAGRFLNVGPRSAGAVPGPACYGQGGTEPTVTDANVVLGRLGTERPLGGEIRLDRERARAAVGELAGRLAMDEVRVAEGIIALAVTKMTASIKEISIMRGHDPRDFALFAYGGAGPLHAALIAAELGCGRVVVPPMPGNFAAFGLLVADVRHDYVRTHTVPAAALPFEELRRIVGEMRAEGRRALAEDGFAEEAMRFEARLDMRYIGQSFELSVELPEGAASMADVEGAFRRAYEKRYAYAVADPAEVVNFRVAAYGLVAKPDLPELGAGGSLERARTGERPVIFGAGALPTALYDRALLPPGAAFGGPAIIEEAGAVTAVPPGFCACVDAFGNLVLERAHG
jgi:N-methylhydantoinase A